MAQTTVGRGAVLAISRIPELPAVAEILDSTEIRYPWSITDPHTAQIWADPESNHPVISLRYRDAWFTP